MFNIETGVVDRVANSLSDAEILAISALLFGLVGGLVAFLANRIWFRRWPTHAAYDDKLGEAAHTSMLGFSAFVLALLITNGLSTLSETDKAVRAAATTVYRLGQELDALGPSVGGARLALDSYAKNVGQDEWPRLATLPVSLSPIVQKNLDDLWIAVRTLQEKLAEIIRTTSGSFFFSLSSQPPFLAGARPQSASASRSTSCICLQSDWRLAW